MHNPTFSFDVGQPVEDRGRWIEGRVIGDDDGYTLQANLCLSRDIKGCDLSMHRMSVRVDRAFTPSEFAQLLQPLRTGRFATVTSAFRLIKLENTVLLTEDMEAALSVGPEQNDNSPAALKKPLAAVCTELDTLTKREILGRAFMMVGSRPGAHIIIGDRATPGSNPPG